MTNEEIQRTMELILQGQARFDARMEKDEARTAKTMEFLLEGGRGLMQERQRTKLA